MADISHQFGSDLLVAPSGDLATATGTALGQQRVLRRLLTNPSDYIWQLTYGAGLAGFVGQPASANLIRGVVRTQLLRERVVARAPEPAIDVVANDDGTVYVNVRYVDADSGQTQILGFRLGES